MSDAAGYSEYSPLLLREEINLRTVIGCTRLCERVKGDSSSTWVAVCHDPTAYHPFMVWNIIARPDGFMAEGGDSCHTSCPYGLTTRFNF
jgi:hypothetical protein